MIEKFNFTSRAKSILISLIVVGLALVIVGTLTQKGENNSRFWANFLLSNFYFTAISVLSVAWMAIQYQAKASWATGFKRVSEAMSSYLPFGLVAMLVLVLFSFVKIGGHDSGAKALYQWMNADEVKKEEVLQGKSAFLNFGFFAIRVLVYYTIWILFARMYRKHSLKEEAEGGLKYYNKSSYMSAAFLPLFGLSFCLAAFDWLMSTEPKWYSTMFGVNVFASSLVGFCSVTVIIITLLKRANYLSIINDNHYHDLGKFMFGFSIFWTYTWFAQFMLIWYANLPEEIVYFTKRMEGNWRYLFFGNLCINFFVPFLGLMTRNAKRMYNYLFVMAILLLVGRYTDWYLAIMRGTAGDQAGFGPMEIGFFLFFGGVFGYVVGNALTKANLIPVKHPLLEESIQHDI